MKQLPAEGALRTSNPGPRAVPSHLKYAGIKGAANLLRKHGHIGEALHGEIVKHADRNMKKAK